MTKNNFPTAARDPKLRAERNHLFIVIATFFTIGFLFGMFVQIGLSEFLNAKAAATVESLQSGE